MVANFVLALACPTGRERHSQQTTAEQIPPKAEVG